MPCLPTLPFSKVRWTMNKVIIRRTQETPFIHTRFFFFFVVVVVVVVVRVRVIIYILSKINASLKLYIYIYMIHTCTSEVLYTYIHTYIHTYSYFCEDLFIIKKTSSFFEKVLKKKVFFSGKITTMYIYLHITY